MAEKKKAGPRKVGEWKKRLWESYPDILAERGAVMYERLKEATDTVNAWAKEAGYVGDYSTHRVGMWAQEDAKGKGGKTPAQPDPTGNGTPARSAARSSSADDGKPRKALYELVTAVDALIAEYGADQVRQVVDALETTWERNH